MSTPKYSLANLSGTYAYNLVRPGLTKLGTLVFDGAGNLDNTDMDVPGETRKSTGNGTDYTVDGATGSGSLKIMFHMQSGGVFGPWFKFLPCQGFRKLFIVSEDGSIAGTAEAQ